MRKVDVFLYDGVNALDISGISEALCLATINGKAAYQLRYISLNGQQVRTNCGLKLAADICLLDADGGDDLIIPGGANIDMQFSNHALVKRIAEWQKNNAHKRLISICSGALLLAHAGVLNQKKATSHWRREQQAKALFPKVNWNINAIFEHDCNIFTSAGVSCGIDLGLSIIKLDCGNKEALKVAQELVVSTHRAGGQMQFSNILQAQFSHQTKLAGLIELLIDKPAENWNLEKMADAIYMTSRTLSRHFNDALQQSPMRYLEYIRVEHAKTLLVDHDNFIKVARQSGFGSEQRMRRAFERQMGLSPSQYAKQFR